MSLVVVGGALVDFLAFVYILLVGAGLVVFLGQGSLLLLRSTLLFVGRFLLF